MDNNILEETLYALLPTQGEALAATAVARLNEAAPAGFAREWEDMKRALLKDLDAFKEKALEKDIVRAYTEMPGMLAKMILAAGITRLAPAYKPMGKDSENGQAFKQFLLETTDLPKVGAMVKPISAKKRKSSSWLPNFGKGKQYKVIAHDTLDNEPVILVQSGATEDDYSVLYPDEI